MLTDYHAKYLAYELTRRSPPDSMESLAGALVDAKVDLNPHQVDAALFAFRSPLSKGALLADEVGLGKTIEAGLVLSQRWAERKRRVLVITPANLRKQWHQELQEKFFLPCRILEAKSYNDAVKKGVENPFEPPKGAETVAICSYQFARNKAPDVQHIPWDLVIIDEAHRLRNVYKPGNVIANTLKEALAPSRKLLLTATPLQNSLLELYGLVSIIDDHIFGDVASFRERFGNAGHSSAFPTLRERLRPVCHRTLRRQVTQYVPYTNRHAILEKFTPADDEDRLYHLVSDYLQRDNLQALPSGQRSLMTLVLRKLLASSTFAIAGALDTLTKRMKAKLAAQPPETSLEDELDEDYEALDETAEEWGADEEPPLSRAERAALEREIKDLESFRDLAVSIDHNAKGLALLRALDRAFAEAENLGAARKAIIFTESRKTQLYIQRLLADTPHAEGVVLFNGSNSDPRSREIYQAWRQRHEGTDRITGSRTADTRAAIVEEFEQRASIMIATEAGAEGINLQFCSLVVNYDLPWNPQRIEQRIGRCHRYGQKHDVVVVNFLNNKNEADQRVFELLDQKFSLFKGVFGSSDEVLGAIETGVDFEKRIAAIYQKCRTSEEIRASFDQLQIELSTEINEQMQQTRQQLLEHFDAEVHDKLRLHKSASEACLSRFERLLMTLTRHELADAAEFDQGGAAFRLRASPFPEAGGGAIPLGLYELPRRSGEAHLYRLGHPLAQRLLERAKGREVEPAEITLDWTNCRPAVAALAPHVGATGEALVTLVTIESLDQTEDHVLVVAGVDGGGLLEEDAARRLFQLPALEVRPLEAREPDPRLSSETERRQAEIRKGVTDRNAGEFQREATKLDGWADDLKLALEREIKDLDRQIREAKRAATAAPGLEEKLAGQKQVKKLEHLRSSKRKTLFEAYDEVDRRREQMISEVEKKLVRKEEVEQLMWFRWRIV